MKRPPIIETVPLGVSERGLEQITHCGAGAGGLRREGDRVVMTVPAPDGDIEIGLTVPMALALARKLEEVARG